MANTIQNGQTCLEKKGIEARQQQLQCNEWRNDLQYSKQLVEAEYNIQVEFPITSYYSSIN